MSADRPGAHSYEIRVAGAVGEGLLHAFTGMRAAHVRPCALLRIEVPGDDQDAADLIALLRERGHSVTSIRRCGPNPLHGGAA
jgi:hypothetical protein